MQELRPVRKIVSARVRAGECDNWNNKKLQGNIFYPPIEAVSKYYDSRSIAPRVIAP